MAVGTAEGLGTIPERGGGEDRQRALERLFRALSHAPRREAERRRERVEAFVTALTELHRARGPTPAEPTDLLSALGLGHRAETHAALLAWLLSPHEAHGLGDLPASTLLAAAGLSPERVGKVLRVRPRGPTVTVDGALGRVEIQVKTPPRPMRHGRATEPSGHTVWVPVTTATERQGPEPLGRDLPLALLGAVVDGLSGACAPPARSFLEGWSAALRRATLGRTTMTEWKGYSPDVRFLLEHWQDYLDVLAVREQLDREFVAQRQHVLDVVRARWPAADGWDATLDEDWILLRRRHWPVPGEEWLAFVVVLSDVESVVTDGREGYWSALSLPTDADFDGEAFTTLVRARLDPNTWRPWLHATWPGYALGRHLPRLDSATVVGQTLEQSTLDELARYAQLVPVVEQALRDMG
jgi:hypothetical protein